MNKCFITKLPSSVDNDNLPVLGKLKISWLKQNNLTNNNARAIGLSTNDSITVEVSNTHFTDSTLTSNLGNIKTITATDGLVWLYISNDADAILTIDNKYSLKQINVVKQFGEESLARSIYFDIEDIKYCTAIISLDLSSTQVSGDISAVSKLTALTYFSLRSTQVNGDINAISNLTKLTNLNLSNTRISGDINAISNLTKLATLNLFNTQVNGDISAISNLTDLSTITLANTRISGDISAVSNLTKINYIDLSSTQVSGAVDNLAGLTKLTDLSNFESVSLTGDMSKVPASVYFISQYKRKFDTNFTWTAKGRQNVTLLAMQGPIPFDTTSMDNMLIDQATCTFKGNGSMPWTKTISVRGTRTAASDAAVAAIQNMGVTITGVTKA